MDLTKVNGCYTKPLAENIDHIYAFASDYCTTKDELVAWILKLIEPAFFNRDAKPRFIYHLHTCKSKKAVFQLCMNAIANAIEYEAV